MKSKLLHLMTVIAALGLGILTGWIARNIAVPGTPESIASMPPEALLPGSEAGSRTPAKLLPIRARFLADLSNALSELTRGRREEALLRLGDSIAVEDIPAVLELLSNRGEPELPVLIERLLRRWAQADPVRAMAYAQSLPASPQRSRYVRAVLLEWTTDAPVAAFEWARQLPESAEKNQLLSAVLELVAGQNPRQALEMIEALGAFPARLALQRSILLRWAESDPAAAANAATQMKGLGSKTLADLAARWAARNLTAALMWARGISSVQARDLAVRQVVQVWAETDPHSAAGFALSQPPGRLRENLLTDIIRHWGNTDVDAMIDWARAMPDGAIPNRILQGIFEQWARADPASAAGFEFPRGIRRDRILETIAHEWFRSDPGAALDWIKSLPPLELRGAAPPVFSMLLATNAQQASGFVLSLSDPRTRANLLIKLGSTWAGRDLSSAIAWMQELPEGFKAVAAASIGEAWVRNDLQSAAEFATTMPHVQSLVTEVARAWGPADPGKAIEWVQTLPEGNVQDEALREVLSAWTRRDPAATATYLTELPLETQEQMLVNVISVWANVDAKAAAEWVSQFPEGKARDESATRLAIYWGARDPVSTAAWLDAIGANPHSRKELFHMWSTQDKQAARGWFERNR
jgi:hypothetical protein